jgi:hypothetical protein
MNKPGAIPTIRDAILHHTKGTSPERPKQMSKWKLIDEKTGRDLNVGDLRLTSRGEEVRITSFAPPHKPESSGKVNVKFIGDDVPGEYYPSVIGAKYVETEIAPPQVHHFASTGEAYDATQCDENIKNGDVLVIASERVVGIADTWPFAITKEFGKLHALEEGTTIETYRDGKFAGSKEIAEQEIAKLPEVNHADR